MQAGVIKTRVKISNLRLMKDEKVKIEGKSITKNIRSTLDTRGVSEIDVRGQNAEEAIMSVDSAIDTAILSHTERLTIIHGKGTGVLRTEIDNLGKIIDVDKITASCGGNLLEGGKKAVALIDECLEKEICFTQETTLSGRKTLDTIKRAIAKDYYIRLYYVGLEKSF